MVEGDRMNNAVVTEPRPFFCGVYKPKPLTNQEINQLADTHLQTRNHDGLLIVLGLEDFARAIEKYHGIKNET
jgi:hypothetical protein